MSIVDTRPAVPAKAGDWVEMRCGWIVGPVEMTDEDFPSVWRDGDEYEWERCGKYAVGESLHDFDIVAVVPRPDSPPQAKPQPDAVEHPSRYHRRFHGVTIDLYRVANLWGVKSHALFHAMKKIVMAGQRGIKDYETDLQEAIVAIEEELKIAKEGGAS